MLDFTVFDYEKATGVADDTVGAFIPSALNLLEELTCGAFTTESTTATGLVCSDGKTVVFDRWAHSVESVSTTDGRTVSASLLEPFSYVFSETGKKGAAYSMRGMLAETLPAGSTVSVNGGFGFSEYPFAIKAFLAALLNEFRSYGSDYGVTHKQIEDVSVTLTEGAATSSPLAKLLPLYRRTLDEWSLCPVSKISGIGELGYPYPLPNPPYWLGARPDSYGSWRYTNGDYMGVRR